MSQKAHLTVYLQALGAHYLGAKACSPQNISVNLVYSGGTIPMPYVVAPEFTDDGNPSPAFIAGSSSFMPMVTVPQLPAEPSTLVHFLSPDFTTARAQANFQLGPGLEFATLNISVPTTTGSPMLFQHPVLLNPLQPEYEVTVVVPGLFLTPDLITEKVAVFVKMMCGCPVTLGPPASLWPANDFTVFASVLDKSGNTTYYPLKYDTTQQGTSLFSASLSKNQNPVASVTFTAIQKSTGNYGAVVQ